MSDINSRYEKIRYGPTLVGGLSPLALILSIPPLIDNLSSFDDDDDSVTSNQIELDSIVTALIATGLLFELMAACFLMARFMEKRIVLTTWLAIISYIAHASFMLGPLITFLALTPPSSQSFLGELTKGYIPNLATSIISIISAILLIVDYFQNNRLRKQGSGVTTSQRQLIFLIILVTLWSAFGAVIFGKVEGWSFTNGIYFTLVTMTTIGFGDLVPSHLGTRIFLFPYAIIGVVVMGLLINAFRIDILDSFQQVYFEQIEKFPSTLTFTNLCRHNVSSSNFLNNEEREETIDFENLLDPVYAPEVRKYKRKLLDERRGIHLIRQLQFSILSLLLFWFLGALIFMFIENWSYFTALYFCFVSFTTIGYGDVTPDTFAGIVAFIGYSLMGLVAAAYVISTGLELFLSSLDRRADHVANKRQKKEGKVNIQADDLEDSIFQIPDNLQTNAEKDTLIEACHEYYAKVALHLADRKGKFSSSLISDPDLNILDKHHLAFGKFLTGMGYPPHKIPLQDFNRDISLLREASFSSLNQGEGIELV